jgi:hypothetical protein
VLAARRAEQAALANGVDLDQASKQNIRGGGVARFFSVPAHAQHVESAVVLSEPIQRLLNKAFAAEVATEAFVQTVEATSWEATSAPADFERLRTE